MKLTKEELREYFYDSYVEFHHDILSTLDCFRATPGISLIKEEVDQMYKILDRVANKAFTQTSDDRKEQT